MRTQGGNEGEAPLRKIAVLAAQSFPQPRRKKAVKPCLKPFLTVFATAYSMLQLRRCFPAKDAQGSEFPLTAGTYLRSQEWAGTEEA